MKNYSMTDEAVTELENFVGAVRELAYQMRGSKYSEAAKQIEVTAGNLRSALGDLNQIKT